MKVYYNDSDPKAAAWLKQLIVEGHLDAGDVDERSILDVSASDLDGYTQCHFFAGIGGWPLALRNAGWPTDRPVWTGSCPCPPFSSAGKKQQCPECGSRHNLCHPRKTGHFICLDCGCDRWADERHLWPEFSRLIRECAPPVVFGEQVASKDGRYWLSVVQADLERVGYAVGGADLCAAGVGAPHMRQRLWFGAERLEHDARDGRVERRTKSGERGVAGGCSGGGVADGEQQGLERHAGDGDGGREPGWVETTESRPTAEGCPHGGMGDTEQLSADRPGEDHFDWGTADWLFCRDGKWRPVEPGTFPLVDGLPGRVGLLRGYGNAVVPKVAETFIEAWMDG